MFYISWYWLCRKISSLPSLTQAFSITNAVFWERHCLKYVSKESFINLIGYINIRSFCLKVIFLPVKKEREIITSSFTQARFVKFRLLKGTRHARWPNTHLVRQVLIHRRTLFCSLGELKIFSATCLPGNGWTLADPLTFLKNWTVTQIETKREHRQRCIFAKCIFVSVFLGHVWGMSETCLGHHPGHVWALSGACLEHHMGHVCGIIWGMSGTTSGAYCLQWTTIRGATCICDAVFKVSFEHHVIHPSRKTQSDRQISSLWPIDHIMITKLYLESEDWELVLHPWHPNRHWTGTGCPCKWVRWVQPIWCRLIENLAKSQRQNHSVPTFYTK